MNLKELLSVVGKVASENGIREPYIVGGVPRDIALGLLDSINDIDLTNGEKDISRLADLVAARLGVEPIVLSDGHKKIRFERFSIDFSTNQIYEGIDQLLMARGLSVASNLLRETYCRDFTINTLLLPLDFSKIIDLTAMGKYDVEHRILRCPVDAAVAIEASPNRIIRAFYYAAKYSMKIDDSLKNAIRNNLNLLDKVKPKYSSDKLTEAIRFNPEIVNDLIELGVLQKIKLTKEMTDALIKAKRLADIL
jgi:tRNA nucleotidyltransferase/poly(A) polymerase